MSRGNALLYVLLAVGLLAALSYSYVKDSRENYASQSAVQIAETLYSQVNMIKGAIVQCALEYPGGGGDMNKDGVIDTNDNHNNPYPLNPSDANNLNVAITAPAPAASPDAVSGNAAGCIPQRRLTTMSGICNASARRWVQPPCLRAQAIRGASCRRRPADFLNGFTRTMRQAYIQITNIPPAMRLQPMR